VNINSQLLYFKTFKSGNSAVAEKLESNNCQDDIHCEEILLSIKALVPYNVSVSFEALSDTFLSSLDILSNSSLLITAQNISDTLLFVKEASEGTADEVFGRFNDYRETIGRGKIYFKPEVCMFLGIPTGKESSGQIEAAIMLVSEFKKRFKYLIMPVG